MAIVIDASIAIAWCLRDRPGTPDADAAIEQGGLEGIVVPDLFWHEVRSVLLIGERKGRIEVGAMDDHMKDIRTLSIETDADQDDAAVSTLSRQHERLRRRLLGDFDSAQGEALAAGRGAGCRSQPIAIRPGSM